jgi:hypothetical protein
MKDKHLTDFQELKEAVIINAVKNIPKNTKLKVNSQRLIITY